MKRIAALIAMLAAMLLGGAAVAQDNGYGGYGSYRTVTTESWVEEWDAARGQWVRVADASAAADESLPTITTTRVAGQSAVQSHSATRYARPVTARSPAGMLAQYGPFVVTSATSASMVGSTDSMSPLHFDAMLRDFPQLAMLEMVEAPGTSNDIANLAVGRRIRAAGLATHVPRGGSVRSGAVELFLAGVTRTVDDGAQFAVHSWLDTYGREADDFAANDPAHRIYLDYYVEMGMSESRAREFYDMTNSVPHSGALWLKADDMRYWLRPERTPASRMALSPAPEIAHGLAHPRVQLQLATPEIRYSDLDAVALAQIDIAPAYALLDS